MQSYTRKGFWQICFHALGALGLAASVARADDRTVDVKKLGEAGVSTQEKLQASAAASWKVSHALGSGAVIHVSILRAGQMQRDTVTIENKGRQIPVFTRIIRDGLWYVTDRRGSTKYRPFELPADTPFIYIALERSEPRFFNQRMPNLTPQGVEGNAARFKTDLDPVIANQLHSVVDQFESFSRAGHPLSAADQPAMDMAKDMLAHGLTTLVDTVTGQIIEFGSPKIRSHVDDFHFVNSVDQNQFAVNGIQWQDYSDDPTLNNSDDLMMIGNQPGIRPGDKNYELDGRLIDVKSGRFRRIPFKGGEVVPMCFSNHRRCVIVGGLNENGGVCPYEIDLKTQQARALGGALLESGVTLFGDLSPDGKTVAFLHLDLASKSLLKSGQICLVDLASGRAKPLGQPMDTAFINWTADGSHLVLLSRKYADLNSPVITSIAVIDMSGQVKELCRGNAPVLLADRKTILFEDRETRLWHTCDLEGKNEQLFGDGLKGYGFPTPAPDGQRLAMMHFIPNSLPEPVVVEIGASQIHAIPHEGGIWGTPAWR